MKVKVLSQTRLNGHPVFVGDVVNVTKEKAVRLVDAGIVSFEEPFESQHLSAKELYKLCKDNNLEVDAKQSAEYYKQALESAGLEY